MRSWLQHALAGVICLICIGLHAADTDTTVVQATKDLGLYVGSAYTLMDIDANSYTVGTKQGIPELNNSPGIFGGFCYNFYAGRSSIIRPAIEAVFLPATRRWSFLFLGSIQPIV